LAELEWQGSPEHASLRRALRHELRRFMPDLRVVAEDFLAELTSIDLLAVGVEGELVSIRIGKEREAAHLLTRALSDLAWLRPRGADLFKLAPGLGFEPETEPRAMIFCPHFGAETRSAASHLPTRSLALIEYRCLRQQGQLVLLLRDCSPAVARDRRPQTLPEDLEAREPTHTTALAGAGNGGGAPARRADPGTAFRRDRLTAPPSPSAFRTGLTDADLRLEPIDERARG
jgi:hypothetical protein